jgi:hypothetical protein
VQAEAGKELALGASGGKVTFGASFTGRSGLAVLDSPSSVLKQVDFEDNPVKLGEALQAPDGTNFRYVLFLASYEAQGEINGKHPIGAVGTMSFGAAGGRKRTYAVVHRIQHNAGSATAITDTVGSFRLPRQIDRADQLTPGTMLLAEVNGDVALNITATLGYDYSFVRELKDVGLTGDIGLKLNMGLTAALGFSATGRYLISVDRASLDRADKTLRLRLFKMRQKGWSFGLNLAAHLTPKASIEEEVDQLVAAVFGVHGQQVIKELHRIEEWTNPSVDLSDKVAGLATDQGLDLLKKTTGIDPEAEFDKARGRLLEALDLWDELPDRAVNAAWDLLGDAKGNKRKPILGTLSLIADGDDDKRRDALLSLIRDPDFGNKPIGKFLLGIAEKGLFPLLEDTELPEIADRVRNIVDGSAAAETLRKLQVYINDVLNLAKVREFAESDFDELKNKWVVNRISAFLDDKFSFEKLDELKDALHRLLQLRHSIFEKALEAANRQYDFMLAAAWQKTTTREALLDASFDMSNGPAAGLFRDAVAHAKYDDLLTKVKDGVTLHKGAMSHEIKRSSTVEVNMPFYSSKTTRLNRAPANIEAEDDNGRVLLYSLDAKDEITRVNRFRSQLGVNVAISMTPALVRRHGEAPSTWSYDWRFAHSNMRRDEVDNLLRPLVSEYFPTHFPDSAESNLTKWLILLSPPQ